MKNFIALLLIMTFTLKAFSQLEQEWSISIPNDQSNQQISFSTSIDDKILFNKTSFSVVDGEKYYNHHFYVVDYNGEILWDYDWSNDFEDYYYIKIIKNDITNKLFFLIEDTRNLEPDFVGLLTPFDGITWLNEIASQYHHTNNYFKDIAQISTDFLYLSPDGIQSNLIRINDNGDTVWEIEKPYQDKMQQVLISNANDKIMWLVNNKLHLITSDGSIVALNESKYWNRYYNVFCLGDQNVNTIGWGLDFYVEKYDLDFEQISIDDLPYVNNSFMHPIVYSQVDQDDNIYYSGQNIPGNSPQSSFILKYDNESVLSWTHLPDNTPLTMQANNTDIIYMTSNSVVQLNSANGDIVDQVAIENDILLDFPNNYHSVVDFDDQSVFTFTQNTANNFLLTKYKVELTSGINENVTLGFELFPNPSSDFIVLRNYQKGSCQFYTMDGKLIVTKRIKSDRIDVSSLPLGSFMVTFLNEIGVIYNTSNIIKK